MDVDGALAGWHDFYLLLGGASATLVGLLFVAVTLNTDRLRAQESAPTLSFAERTFGAFLLLIVLSLVALVPHLDSAGLAVSWGVTALVGMVRLVRTSHGRIARRRWVVATLSFGLLVLAAGLAARGNDRALAAAALAMFGLLVQALAESWRLLLLFRGPAA